MHLRRREFLRSVGSGAAGLGLGSSLGSFSAPDLRAADTQTLPVPQAVDGMAEVTGSAEVPVPAKSGIDHIIVVTMENRSFDHFLGWLPGAIGNQNLTYTDANGVPHQTFDLATDFEGCGYNDPDHSYDGSRTAYNGGAMDGFLRAGKNDIFSIGYYNEADLPFHAALARSYLVCDQYFASILGPTFPNRFFLWAGQTDRLGDTVQPSGLTTIFDRLHSAGISHRYYFNNVPFLALWGLKYLFSTGLFEDFLEDAATGNLPAVSYVDPIYTVLDDGTGNDDHPHSDVRNGEAFLSRIYQAVTSGPKWANTVLIITFDEWGGFFDHVAPPRVIPSNALDKDSINGGVLLGMRIPAIIVSPFTLHTGTTPQVSSTLFDHTSILKLIEWRWGLTPLTQREASPTIGNLVTSMTFGRPPLALPTVPVPASVFAPPCFFGLFGANAAQTQQQNRALRAAAPVTEWGNLAATPHVTQWLQHPQFKGRLSSTTVY